MGNEIFSKKLICEMLMFVSIGMISLVEAQAKSSNKSKVNCISVKKLKAKIHSCKENDMAVKFAVSCYEKINEKWKKNGSNLNDYLTGKIGKIALSQSGEIAAAVDELKKSRKSLNALMIMTDKNADKIASYPTAMKPGPDGTNSSCFVKPRKDLSLVVESLDKKMIQAKNVNGKIKALTVVSKHSKKSSRSLASENLMFKNQGLSDGSDVGMGRNTADISGTENMVKQK